MTNEDEEIYNNLHVCWICKIELYTDKVRDYFKATGRLTEVPHSKCCISFSHLKKLPIIFHDLQSRNGHLILKELNNFNLDIEVIPKNIDQYMSIIVNKNTTFVDSLQFYKGSLDVLAINLKYEDFKH